jgi:GAF domain-containing protein
MPSAAAETQARPAAESSAAPSQYVHRSNIRATQTEQPSGTQREELAQLEAAQRTLRDDPAAALATMQRHARMYPQSWLAEERDALIIRAQLALHDVARARIGLARFAARYPESPQLRQLERALAEGATRRLPHVDSVD